MKFAIASVEGVSLSWQKRLLDEGHEVLVYHVPHWENGKSLDSPQKLVGEGIVPLESNYNKWRLWGRGGIFLFDSSGKGDLAETIRNSGEKVIGAGNFCDRLESDRSYGLRIAASVGIQSPDTFDFSNIHDAIEFLKSKRGTGKYFFKANKYLESGATYSESSVYLRDYLQNYIIPHYGNRIPCIIQKGMDGFALSTSRWWNGNSFVGPYEGTAERKKFLVGDIGGSTGCSFNLVWFYLDDEPTIVKALHFDKLEEIWRKEKAPPGIYDINALLSKEDGKPYFLEWTPRMGYDAAPTEQRGITDLGKFLECIATGNGDADKYFNRNKIYGGIRLTIGPYPHEKGIEEITRKKLLGIPIRGEDGLWKDFFVAYGVKKDASGYSSADPSGFIGIVCNSGNNCNLFDGSYSFIKNKLHIPNVQYRNDAKESIKEDLATIASLGYETR